MGRVWHKNVAIKAQFLLISRCIVVCRDDYGVCLGGGGCGKLCQRVARARALPSKWAVATPSCNWQARVMRAKLLQHLAATPTPHCHRLLPLVVVALMRFLGVN